MKMTRKDLIDFIMNIYRVRYDFDELEAMKEQLMYMTDTQIEELGEATHYEAISPPDDYDPLYDYNHMPN